MPDNNQKQPEPPEGLPLWHQSGVNGRGEPFIQLIKGTEIIAQMNLDEAREHALAVLEAAEASEQDAFIYDWVKNKVGCGPEQAAGLLGDFRRYRMERTGKRSGQEVRPDGTPGKS